MKITRLFRRTPGTGPYPGQAAERPSERPVQLPGTAALAQVARGPLTRFSGSDDPVHECGDVSPCAGGCFTQVPYVPESERPRVLHPVHASPSAPRCRTCDALWPQYTGQCPAKRERGSEG